MGLLSTIGAASGRAFGLTRVGAAIRDAYFNLTTLLLPGNGTNGAQNNTFLDSSSNNFTITRNGNTTQGTFSPFSQTGWSNHFGSSTSNLKFASDAAFAVGNSNFTVECFVNFTAWASTNQRIFIQGSSGTDNITIQRDSGANNLVVNIQGSSSISYAWSPNIGQWYHIAVVKSGTGTGQVAVYIDGVSVATGTSSTSISQNQVLIGGLDWASGYNMQGYISNLRYTIGAALYTGNFTPTTSALTTTSQGATASQVEILTCQSNRFVDNSTNGFAITVNGTTSVQAFSPFAPTAAYSAATVGGSGYFDGTGDSLSVAYNSAFDFGTGDFTIEAWVYLTATPAESSNILGSLASGGTNFEWRNATQIALGSNGLAWRFTSNSTTFPLNTWMHLAVTRASGTAYMWMNGVSIGSGAETTAFNAQSSAVYIGQSGGGYFRGGYISSLRVTKGGSLYTTGFTPPTGPLTTTVSSGTVSLLCNYTNAGITDATAKNVFETTANAQISTTRSKWGGSSIYLDGSGDALFIPPPQKELLRFANGDFTIEFWAWKSADGAQGYDSVISVSPDGTFNGGFGVELASQRGFLFLSDSAGRVQSNFNPNDSTWHHYAVVRSGNNLTLYQDGVRLATAAFTGTLGVGGNAFVGACGNSTSTNFNGYINDLRVTRGYARYTGASFTVPSAAFPTQ